MDFIMRVSLSNKPFFLLCLLLVLPPASAYSADSGVTIKHAETSVLGEDYVLTADIDYQLSERAQEALENGVPLFWTYQFKVQEQRPYIWNKLLIEKSFRYRIQYHALVKMYRVSNESNGSVDNYSTLQSALDKLSTISDYRLIEKTKISAQENYIAGVKITFERDALPLPLRPVAYMNPQWYLSSDWYTWSLKK